MFYKHVALLHDVLPTLLTHCAAAHCMQGQNIAMPCTMSAPNKARS